jgi:hypothetical protein
VYGQCELGDVSSFATEFAVAFYTDTIESLDKRYCLAGPLEVVADHSIRDASEKAQVKSFAGLAAWLSARRRESIPYSDIWPFQGCSAGICLFEGGNQKHNHVFLTHIRYSRAPNGASLTSIRFEDGD